MTDELRHPALLDRSDAVNLASNIVSGLDTGGYDTVTDKGIKCLADAVLRLDAALRADKDAMRGACHDAAEENSGCWRAVHAEGELARIRAAFGVESNDDVIVRAHELEDKAAPGYVRGLEDARKAAWDAIHFAIGQNRKNLRAFVQGYVDEAIRALAAQSVAQNAAAGSGGRETITSDSQESPAAGHCQSAAQINAKGQERNRRMGMEANPQGLSAKNETRQGNNALPNQGVNPDPAPSAPIAAPQVNREAHPPCTGATDHAESATLSARCAVVPRELLDELMQIYRWCPSVSAGVNAGPGNRLRDFMDAAPAAQGKTPRNLGADIELLDDVDLLWRELASYDARILELGMQRNELERKLLQAEHDAARDRLIAADEVSARVELQQELADSKGRAERAIEERDTLGREREETMMEIAHIVMGFHNEDSAGHYNMLRDVAEVVEKSGTTQPTGKTPTDGSRLSNKMPLSPEVLIDARQDKIHTDLGRTRVATAQRVGVEPIGWMAEKFVATFTLSAQDTEDSYRVFQHHLECAPESTVADIFKWKDAFGKGATPISLTSLTIERLEQLP